MLHGLRHKWPQKKDLCPQNFFYGGPKGRGARDARPQSKFFHFHAVFHKSFCKTRMRSSRMRTACSSSRHGAWAWRPSPTRSPQLPPWLWAWRPPQPDPPQLPPWLWAWRPPRPDPPNFPLGCGTGNLQGMLGYYLQCMLGYHHPPPREQNDRCKNITLPQTSFAGGNNRLALPFEIWRPLVFLLTVLTSDLYVLISVH